MNLGKLVINNLFGHFNHVVEFKEGNITIIIAPNGYGKTICLKVIDSIFNGKLSYLEKLDFESIELHTDNGNIYFKKTKESKEKSIHISSDNGDSYTHLQNNDVISKRFPASMIERRIPFLSRVGPNLWEHDHTDEMFSFSEILETYSDLFPDQISNSDDNPLWYKEFRASLKTHFVQDQRLILRKEMLGRSINRKSYIDTIEKYADELSTLIRNASLNSSSVSQKLDSTFPQRLLRKYQSNSLTINELKKSLQELQERRTDLSELGLISSEKYLSNISSLGEIGEEDTKVLTLYVNDTKEKLSAYDALFKKIELFYEILNTKRLSFKKLKIDSKKGFYFVTEKNKKLKLTQLSSGEQHQVVLLYELIFKADENVLVLIDEPEISLHVAWQKEFLNDLKKIIAIQNMPVVIATHSPQIIDNNWELTVSLEEGFIK